MYCKKILLIGIFLALQGCTVANDDLEAPAYEYNATPNMDYMYRSPSPAVIRRAQ